MKCLNTQLAFILSAALTALTCAERKIVCYVGTWAIYRPGRGSFGIEHIDPFICTHLMYSFFGINEDGTIRIIDPYLDLEENWGRGHIKQFNTLKLVNPALKTMAAIGGWNEGSRKFSLVAANPALRQQFVRSSIEFCKTHNFDGVDLDWEYPAQRDGNENIDKENHALWLEEIRKAYDVEGLILSAAVASAEFSSGKSYDIPRVSAALHFMNVMTYDLHGAWENVSGLNAPLFSGPADVSAVQQQLNINASIHYWVSQGAPKEKIVMGIPLYGRSFTLVNPTKNHIGAATSGPGNAGPYSREPGVMGYNEFCEKLQTEQWDINFSEEQVGFYATQGNQWLGFENSASIELKMDYLLKMGLGGAMVWSLESDDFHGVCNEGKNVLMNKIYRAIHNGVDPPTTAATTPTTGAPKECFNEGIFPNPQSCEKYYICTGDGYRYDFLCPNGLWFDPTNKYCNWPELVDCGSSYDYHA